MRCKCGAKPTLDTDPMTGATFIECARCSRLAGGPNIIEAKLMWDAAIAKLLKNEIQSDRGEK